MAKTYAPSLLDQLLGAAADAPGRGDAALRLSVEQVKDSVGRDIQLLLNTRAAYRASELDDFPQLRRSLLTLGLSDLASLSLASDQDRRRITEAIRSALSEHDKRLRNVEVQVRPSKLALGGLAFTIRARLLLHPDAQPVVFDAILQPGSQRYVVSKADARGVGVE